MGTAKFTVLHGAFLGLLFLCPASRRKLFATAAEAAKAMSIAAGHHTLSQ